MVSSGKVNWGILSTMNIGIKRVIPAIEESPNGRHLVYPGFLILKDLERLSDK